MLCMLTLGFEYGVSQQDPDSMGKVSDYYKTHSGIQEPSISQVSSIH